MQHHTLGRFCSTHNTYENYVRCLRTTSVKIGFACAFGSTYVVTYVFPPFLPSTWPHAGTDARRLRLPARAAGRRWPWSALLSCERHLRWCQELRWSSNQSLSARKHWSINSYSPASPRLSVVTGAEGDPEGEALASMLKRTGRRDRDLLKLTWTKMSERKVQKSDHQLPFLIELATQLNFFFFWRETKDSVELVAASYGLASVWNRAHTYSRYGYFVWESARNVWAFSSAIQSMGHIHLRGKWRPRTPRWYNAALTHTKWMGNPSSPTMSSNCENRRAFFAKPAQGCMCEVY